MEDGHFHATPTRAHLGPATTLLLFGACALFRARLTNASICRCTASIGKCPVQCSIPLDRRGQDWSSRLTLLQARPACRHSRLTNVLGRNPRCNPRTDGPNKRSLCWDQGTKPPASEPWGQTHLKQCGSARTWPLTVAVASGPVLKPSVPDRQARARRFLIASASAKSNLQPQSASKPLPLATFQCALQKHHQNSKRSMSVLLFVGANTLVDTGAFRACRSASQPRQSIA